MSHTVEIQIIGSSDASSVIGAWEKEDKYHAGITNAVANEVNMAARKYPYVKSSEAVGSTMTMNMNVPVKGPLQLVYLDGRSGAGLPHTRGKRGIALPVFLLWIPSESTLRHEIVHLSQKQFRGRWWRMYRDAWKFRVAVASEFMDIPERWRKRRRINPDTLGTPFTVWKDRYIPLSVFINERSPDLRECKRGFWDLKMKQWTWEAPPGWTELFGSGFNDEHPNEIAAHWIDGSAGKERVNFHLKYM